MKSVIFPHAGGKMTDKKDKITYILGQDNEHMGMMGQDDDIYIAYGFVILPQSPCPDYK